jgi:phosphate uptake regulator
MTLLATLSTAASVRESVAERRAGRDPSAQEPADRAATRLRNAGRSLMDLLMQMALSRVPLEQQDAEQLSHAVRHFDLLLKLRRAERLTQAMHQHLLSLYPDVSEALVEEARKTHDAIEEFLKTAPTDAEGPHLSDVLERGISFVVWTRHEV